MVDVVGELFLDAYFLLFLVQREGVLAVAVGSGFLQTGVEADDVARYFAQFVVGKCREVVDPLAPLGPFGEFVQPGDVLAQAARGEKARTLISSVTPSMNQRNSRSAARIPPSGTE